MVTVLSVNLDADLAIKVFIEGENELAQTELNKVRMGFEALKVVALKGIDEALTQVPTR